MSGFQQVREVKVILRNECYWWLDVYHQNYLSIISEETGKETDKETVYVFRLPPRQNPTYSMSLTISYCHCESTNHFGDTLFRHAVIGGNRLGLAVIWTCGVRWFHAFRWENGRGDEWNVGSDSNFVPLWAFFGWYNLGLWGMCFLREKRPEPVANGTVRIALMRRARRCQINWDIMRIEGAIL